MANKNDDTPDFLEIDPEILARAEKAVAALGGNFIEQMKESLAAKRAQLESMGTVPDADASQDIFSFAHDMRGQGGSFGYPLLSTIGGSLCHFLEMRDFRLIAGDVVVVQSHFDAAAAILANDISGDGDLVSQALVESLDQLVSKRLEDLS